METNLAVKEAMELSPAKEKTMLANLAMKQAQFYAQSTIVPKEYQNNVSNCFIAIEMANRMNANPFQVMQSLNIICGRPAWSSKFIIGAINQCGRFKTPLNYKMSGSWKDHTLSCIAYAISKDGTMCESTPVTWEMANAEGWIKKNGSKWNTMPELMIRYRAASFFGNQYCPDLLLGLMSAEEQREIIDIVPDSSETKFATSNEVSKEQEQKIGSKEQPTATAQPTQPTKEEEEDELPPAAPQGIYNV